MTIPVDEWLRAMSNEYLETFVPEGGAAVKFVIPPARDESFIVSLSREAASRNYMVAFVDAGTTRVHLIDQLFFAVSRQVDWEGLAANVRERSLIESAYVLPEDGGQPVTFASIAEANHVTPQMVRLNLQQWFTDKIFHDYHMTQEFRQAMSILCFEPLRSPVPGDGSLYQTVMDWLRGEARLLSALRPAFIYQRIARHNARDLFASLGHWSQLAGRPGIVVIVDFRACAATSRALSPPDSMFYTKRALVEFYEVMRQFVDATDDLEGFFMAAIGAPEFLTDDERGIRKYRALEMRVAEEVRDRTHDNPLATLSRLTGEA